MMDCGKLRTYAEFYRRTESADAYGKLKSVYARLCGRYCRFTSVSTREQEETEKLAAEVTHNLWCRIASLKETDKVKVRNVWYNIVEIKPDRTGNRDMIVKLCRTEGETAPELAAGVVE